MHPLEEWLIVKRWSKEKFSKASDLSLVTIYKVLRNTVISRRTAMKIEIATSRAVTMEQLEKSNGFYVHYTAQSDADETAEAMQG